MEKKVEEVKNKICEIIGADTNQSCKDCNIWVDDKCLLNTLHDLSIPILTGMCGQTPRIKMGKLSICLQDKDDESKGVWIEQEDGEGGGFNIDKVEKVLQDFYNKNF